VARLLAAPARSGSPPPSSARRRARDRRRADRRPRVRARRGRPRAGDHLASYDIRRIEVELTPDERALRREAGHLRRVRPGRGDHVHERERLSGTRQALRQRPGREGGAPRETGRPRDHDERAPEDRPLESILDRHRDDRVIVFTAHTDLVYRLSAIPAARDHRRDGREGAPRDFWSASARGPTVGSSPPTSSTRASTCPTRTSRSCSPARGVNESSPSGSGGCSVPKTTVGGRSSTRSSARRPRRSGWRAGGGEQCYWVTMSNSWLFVDRNCQIYVESTRFGLTESLFINRSEVSLFAIYKLLTSLR